MNRETKRLLQRQGQMGADGAPAARRQPATPVKRQARRRTSPAEFVRQVRDEMRHVAWPNRTEMVNYTTVVLTTLVLMISLIFLLNYGIGKAVLFLFQK